MVFAAVVVVLVGLRAALPAGVRHAIESHAGRFAPVRITVGDVDLSLLRGGIALDHVALWLTAGEPGALPVVTWKRLEVSVRWLPPLGRSVRLGEVRIESPRVALERLADGSVNLLAAIPAGAPAVDSRETDTAATASAWRVGIDRLTVVDGDVHMEDLAVPASEPIDVAVEAVELRDLSLLGDPGTRPAEVRMGGAVDEGTFWLDAWVMPNGHGSTIDASIDAQRLPLRRLRVYLPQTGWSELAGEADASLRYRFDGGQVHTVTGTTALRAVAVSVPGEEEPVVTWDLLSAKFDPIDFAARSLTVREGEWSGVSLIARPGSPNVLPVLPSTPTRPTGGDQPGPPPWGWSLANFSVKDSRLRLIGTNTTLDVGVDWTLSNVGGDVGVIGRTEGTLSVGDGRIKVAGAVRAVPPGFQGVLEVNGLPLAEAVAGSAALPVDTVRSGRLDTSLTIEAGLAAAADAPGAVGRDDVRLRGRVAVSDCVVGSEKGPAAASMGSLDVTVDDLLLRGALRSAGAGSPGESAPAIDMQARGHAAATNVAFKTNEPAGLSVSAGSVGFDLATLSVRVPGGPPATTRFGKTLSLTGRISAADVVARLADSADCAGEIRSLDIPIERLESGEGKGDLAAAASAPSIEIALGRCRVDGAVARLTRTADGFVLPQFRGASSGEPGPAPQLRVSAAEIGLRSARFMLTDRTVTPPFRGGVSPFSIDLKGVRWPSPAVESAALTAEAIHGGTVQATGALPSDAPGWIEIDAKRIGLPALNAYLTELSGYRAASGEASLFTKAWFRGEEFGVDNWITLHTLGLEGERGQALFQQQFGVPLSVALALLRDVDGDIGLDVPVSGDASGTRVGLLTVVGDALRRALINALASPLKLVGAFFGGTADAVPSVASLPFRAGRAVFAPEAEDRLIRLGALLAARPTLRIVLRAAPTADDVRWLREQALRDAWAGEGVLGTLRALRDRGLRERVREALDARAEDRPGELAPADAAQLDLWLDEHAPPGPEALERLLTDRVTRAETALREEAAVAAESIRREEPALEPIDGPPGVRVEFEASEG